MHSREGAYVRLPDGNRFAEFDYNTLNLKALKLFYYFWPNQHMGNGVISFIPAEEGI